jgi:hypothetical protein
MSAFLAKNMNKQAHCLSNKYFITKDMRLVHLNILIDYLHQQQMFLSELHNMYKGELYYFGGIGDTGGS